MQWLHALGTVASLAVTFPNQIPIPDELPRSWDLKELERQVPPYGAKGRVYVLAWKAYGDEQPLTGGSCLVMRVLDKDYGGDRWCLQHLYRSPREKKPRWRISMIHVQTDNPKFIGLWLFHSKWFKERPKNKEIYASLSPVEGVNWRFTRPTAWKFSQCRVCERNWEAVTGEKPTRFFGK
jgi:hypothetical protein